MGVFVVIILVFALSYLIWLGWMTSAWMAAADHRPKSTSIEGLSIVVAFRDEAHNLPGLIEDFLSQNSQLPFEVLFINDHSSDGGNLLIPEDPRIRILSLEEKEHGKKAAIRAGVLAARFPFIATLDADVRIGHEWMEKISQAFAQNAAELLILPVFIDGGKGFFSDMQSLEFASVVGVTGAMAMKRMPVMCNGANLAFTKEAWLRAESERIDQRISSGDDIFLLENLVKRKKVEWVHDTGVIARSQAEPNLSSFLSQRIRWASKAGHFTQTTTRIIGILVTGMNFLLVSLLILSIFHHLFLLFFLLLFCIKFITDAVLIIPVLIWVKRPSLLKLYPLVSLIYPFYSVVVTLAALFVRPTWKGRTIER